LLDASFNLLGFPRQCFEGAELAVQLVELAPALVGAQEVAGERQTR
jgi:hypothetical protein